MIVGRPFGRDQSIDRLRRAQSRVFLITGDSGIGKSAVLTAACAESAGAALPPAGVVRGDVLGNILLRLLADVVAHVAGDAASQRLFARRLYKKARTVGTQLLDQLPRLYIAQLLALLQVSEEVRDEVVAYARELATAAEEGLKAAILAELQPESERVFAALAADVASFADMSLTLAVDQGEVLPGADIERLPAFAERLPKTVRLWVAMTTATPEQFERVASISEQSSRIGHMELGPLDEDATAAWLRSKGLDERLAGAIQFRTGGYPLHIETEIQDLRAGGAVGQAPRHRRFEEGTKMTWQRLDVDARRAAAQLAVLANPLPTDEMRKLLHLEDDWFAWDDLMGRLERSRILSVVVDGIPWFHEQRRRLIVGSLVPATTVADLCAEAAGYLWHFVQTGAGDQDRYFLQLGDLAGRASERARVEVKAIGRWLNALPTSYLREFASATARIAETSLGIAPPRGLITTMVAAAVSIDDRLVSAAVDEMAGAEGVLDSEEAWMHFVRVAAAAAVARSSETSGD
jgi:hypothetical protein